MAGRELSIPGVVGHLTIEQVPLKGPRLAVDGQRLKPRGFPPDHVTLPGEDGPIEARLRSRILHPHPVVSIGGTDYPTAPPVPKPLLVFMLAPLLGLILVQGVLGVVLVLLGVQVNQSVLRAARPAHIQVAWMTVVLAAVLGVDLLVAIAFG